MKKKSYSLDQCALYNVRSRTRLAKILNRSAGFLQARVSDEIYSVWDEPKKSGGFRTIEAPRDDLKQIQKRIADLLQRVLPPAFLYSPVKGRSYIDNAMQHRNASEIRLLDVANYFGNCRATAVYHFFFHDLKCSPDVAWLLTSLTTRGGHLPQGSPASPILSYFSCRNMWDEIAGFVAQQDCSVTVYVDDITVSGKVVKQSLVWDIKRILRRNGHSIQSKKERRHLARPAEVTGIMVHNGRASVPHRHYKKLQGARLDSKLAESEELRASATARARSLESQIQSLHLRNSNR